MLGVAKPDEPRRLLVVGAGNRCRSVYGFILADCGDWLRSGIGFGVKPRRSS